MGKSAKNKLVLLFILGLVATIGFLGIREAVKTRQAHQSFENYYAFRGCSQLLERKADYGICKLPSGQNLKLVKFQERWYLDGDLPVCFFKVCL